MNSFCAPLLLSIITLAEVLWPGAAQAQSTETKNPEGLPTVMRGRAFFQTVGTVFSDHDLPAHLRYIRSENGGRPLGYHIEGEFGVLHDEHDGDLHVVYFYVVDKHGRKCSAPAGTCLNHEFLKFQWFDHQRCLLVISNAHKHFEIHVFARDAKGDFKLLDAKIDPYETTKKIAVVTFLKGHPEWDRAVLGPFKEGESSPQVLGGDSASVDNVSDDDTTIDISAYEVIVPDDSTVRICYRFDAGTQKFTRLKAMLLGERLRPVLTLSNANLEKAIKKVALP